MDILDIFKCILRANIENYKIEVVTGEDRRSLNVIFKGVKPVGNKINVDNIAPAGIYITTDEYCKHIGKPDAVFENKLHKIVFYADWSCMDNEVFAQLYHNRKVKIDNERQGTIVGYRKNSNMVIVSYIDMADIDEEDVIISGEKGGTSFKKKSFKNIDFLD